MHQKPDPSRLDLASYPTVTSIQARFSDLDVFGHINNVAIAGFYEEARTGFVRQAFGTGADRDAALGQIFVVNVNISYLHEARYPGAYSIGVGVLQVGRTSFQVGCGMFDGDRCVGLSEAVFVQLADGGPAPLSAGARAVLHSLALPGSEAESMRPPTRGASEQPAVTHSG